MRAERTRTLRFGAFEVDLRAHTLCRRGRRVRLQEKSFRLLALLLERAGEAISREELRRELWPSDTNVEFEDGLNHVVRRLREALDDSADAPRFIETVPRFGYRFIGLVQGAPASEASPPGSPPAAGHMVGPTRTGGSAESGPAPPAAPPRRPHTATLVLTLTAAGVLATVVATMRPGPSATAPAAVGSIAVLPFRSLTGTDEGQRFAEGMTDALITDLARHSDLRVLSYTSVLRFAGSRQTAGEIGRELGADAIVEATLQRAGERLRVNVQLIDARVDRHLWAERYDRDLHDVLRLQDELGAAIAACVLGAVEPGAAARARSVRPDAYLAYVRARHFSERPEPEAVEAAAAEYRRAIALDPGYAAPHAWLARHIVRRVHGNEIAPHQAFPEVERLARRALELEPGLAEAEVPLGARQLFYEWDLAGALEALASAAGRLPTDGEAQSYYAEALAANGRTREAVELMRAAAERSPGVLHPRVALALYLYLDRQHSQAVREAQAVLDLEPQFGVSHVIIGFAQLASGNAAQARSSFERALGDAPQYAGLVGHARARAGDPAGARAVLAALERRSTSGWISPVQPALVHLALGENDEAFAWLERAIEERDHDMPFVAVWPMFDSLRADPRFPALLRRLQLR